MLAASCGQSRLLYTEQRYSAERPGCTIGHVPVSCVCLCLLGLYLAFEIPLQHLPWCRSTATWWMLGVWYCHRQQQMSCVDISC